MAITQQQQAHIDKICDVFSILLKITQKRQELKVLTAQKYQPVPTEKIIPEFGFWTKSWNELMISADRLDRLMSQRPKAILLQEIETLRSQAKCLKETAQKEIVANVQYSSKETLQVLFKNAHSQASAVFDEASESCLEARFQVATEVFRECYGQALMVYVDRLLDSPVSVAMARPFSPI